MTSDAGVQRETASDATGHYTFSLLPPGNYRIETEKPGFGKATTDGVTVRITEITRLDIRLEVATQKSVVEVTSETPLVQADNATRGTVIQQEQIRQLPLPTRNFQQLLTLTTRDVRSRAELIRVGPWAAPIYVDGLRATSNSVIINGIDANSIGTGSTPNLAVPATDTLAGIYRPDQPVRRVARTGCGGRRGGSDEIRDEMNFMETFMSSSGTPCSTPTISS